MNKIAIVFLSCFCLSAQHEHSSSAPTEKPVVLYSGMGAWRHPIATKKPEAQKFFDQGLALNYGFNRYEALRSFRKVLELDPHAAMAYWGIATVEGPYLNMDMDETHMKEACEAAEQGLRVPELSPTDRDWLNTAAAKCPDYSDPGRYVHAMHELAAKYPDDPDAQTLYAEALLLPVRWRWYDSQGHPAAGVHEAEQILEAVMRRYPQHAGANHLYIHAVESSTNPERAIPSAQRLMGIVPSAGHLVHMPGHIWLVLGDYNTTVDVNERAAEVDRRYFQQTGVMSGYYPYYLHNLQFILYARAMQGRVADTQAAAKQITEAAEPMAKMMPDMAGVFNVLVTMSQLRVCRWDDVLNAPASNSGNLMAETMRHHARAIAFAGKGQMEEARREAAEFENLKRTLDRKLPWDTNKLGDVLDLASATLEARTQKSAADAVPKWKRAVELQDALTYDEPPAWYYPVRESLGAALLLAGDAAGAEAVFREGVRRSPNNGRMLFGLLESLKAQGKTDAAAWVQREFESAWKGADLELRLGVL